MLKNSKKKLLFAGIAAAMAFTVTACGADTNGDTGANGGAETNDGTDVAVGQDRLVVAQNSDARTLDLHASNDSNSSLVNVQIFDTLVTQDLNTMEILPGLATEWRQIDDYTWEFDLKEGVYFHNGERFNAHDVYFSFQRALESPAVAVIMDQIDPERIEILDDYTIKISTVQPFAPILSHLAHSAAGIKNEIAVTEAGDAVGQQPVGTGPFKFVNWVSGDYVQLERFEDFHGDLPVYRELVIRAITEVNSRVVGLETGEIDIALQMGAPERRIIEDNNNLDLLTTKNFSTSYIGFNTNRAPFDDVRVRQAINYAVDVASILEFVNEGIGELAKGPIGSNVWGACDDLVMFGYDVERARELMAEAGLADGFTTTIYVSDSQANIDIVTVVRNQLLENLGIDADISIFDWGAYLEALSGNDHYMFIVAWGSVTGDADYGLFPLFHSSVDPSGGNRMHFSNERVDELLEMGRATTDPNERLEIYAEVQQLIIDEAPWLFLFTGEASAGLQSNIRGFNLNPATHHRFATVYFE